VSLWCKRGRALLWVGAGLLGGRSIAVHKHVPMNSRLTSPISGMYAMFPIHGVVKLKQRQCSWLSIDTSFVSFCQSACLKNSIK
jgi:hypothetical protein